MEELRKRFRIATLIGFAMIGSLPIYIVIVEMMKAMNLHDRGILSPSFVELLRFIFLGLSILLFFIIRWIRKLFLAPRDRSQIPSGPQETLSPKIQKLLNVTIITYALCESVAIYGLVLFFIGRSSFDFYLFIFLSLTYFFLYFPRYSQWEEWVLPPATPL